MSFRHLLTAVLCCVVTFGHAPAWLHVATCDDAACVKSSGTAATSKVSADEAGCRSCCSHAHGSAVRAIAMGASSPRPADASRFAAEAATETDPSGHSSSSGQPLGEHSSDDCTICHSLLSVLGQIDFRGPIDVALEPLHFVSFAASEAPTESIGHALQTRGPPSC